MGCSGCSPVARLLRELGYERDADDQWRLRPDAPAYVQLTDEQGRAFHIRHDTRVN